MSTHKNIERICVIAVVAALLLTAVLMSCDFSQIIVSESRSLYESRLFTTDKVHTIDIYMDNWDSFIDSCTSEEYSVCDLVIDGESYQNIAIRGKGNTSLSNVSSMDSDRYSFKIEFDHYSSGNSYYGLDKLSLNNIIQDNTYMKDYLTYRMMGEFGVAAPLCSFVYITVNGEDWGLYLAVEGIEDAFLQRNYGNDYGELYKPDSMSFGGGRGNGKDFDMDAFLSDDTDSETSSSETTSGSMPDMGNMPDMGEMPDMSNMVPGGMGGFSIDEEALRQAFRELGLDEALLDGIDFDNITMENLQSVISSVGFDKTFELMEILSEDMGSFSDMGGGKGGMMGGMGSSDVKLQYIDDNPESYSNIFDNAKTDITTADQNRLIASLKTLSSGESIESVVDVESVIRYFVVHNYVCNGDSYTGSMIHNYYLYEKDSQMSMIPWDYNLAFGAFQSSSATDTVNSPIDTPVSGSSDDRPMIDWIFDSEEYTALYHEYFALFLEEIDVQSIIAQAQELISPYVEKDPTKFCTYEEFTKGVETLAEFCRLRSESVEGQLNGTIPATTSGQSSDPSALTDASHITISDMGSMGMGGFGGFGGGKGNMSGSDRNSSGKQDMANNTTSATETTTETTTKADTESQPSSSAQTPEMPEGFPEQGEMPEMPENMQDGNMPTPPDGMGNGNGKGQRPQGDFSDMNPADKGTQAENFAQMQQEASDNIQPGAPDNTQQEISDNSQQEVPDNTQQQISDNTQQDTSSQARPQRGGSTESMSFSSATSSQEIITVIISLIFLAAGLIFALKFKRRRDS